MDFAPQTLTDPYDRTTTVLVQTVNGKVYAVGEGVVLQMKGFNAVTGQFEKPADGQYSGIAFDSLQDDSKVVVVGQAWPKDTNDAVAQVMWDGKKYLQDDDLRSGQIEKPNSFDSAHKQLTDFREALEKTGQTVDYY